MSGIKSNKYIESEDKKYSFLYKKGYGQGPIDVIMKELNSLNITLDNKNVLDCGCGHSPILEIFNMEKYVGIDISSFQIEKLKKKNPNIEYYHGSIHDLSKFKDKQFDYVWCSDVLEHIEENLIVNVLSEISRVSKNSIISVSTRNSVVLDEEHKNLHVNVKDIEWWDSEMNKFYNTKHKIELFRGNIKMDCYLFINENL